MVNSDVARIAYFVVEKERAVEIVRAEKVDAREPAFLVFPWRVTTMRTLQ